MPKWIARNAIVMRRFLRGPGGEPGATALHTGGMLGDPGLGPHVAIGLPRAFGDGAEALFAAAPDAFDLAGAARGSPETPTLTDIERGLASASSGASPWSTNPFSASRRPPYCVGNPSSSGIFAEIA